MRTKGRRVVVSALNQLYVTDMQEAFLPFSYGARRIQASLTYPPIPGADVTMLESTTLDAEATAAPIIALQPDVVGFSTYLWSFPTFCEAARIVRRQLPNCTIVFGGPSSRPAMVDHPAFSWVRGYIDALVVREGEQMMRAIVESEDRSPEGLAKIPGLVLPRGPSPDAGWFATPSPTLVPMDDLPSPHQMGLVAEGITANLETFRGCPLACAFCEWGVYEGSNRVFSEEYLVRELEAFKRTKATGAYLVDAGFSLNRKAFRNLAAAERQVKFLADQPLACEVYASNLREDDVEFLASVNVGRIGVGLQSFNPDVLRLMQRPFDEARFLRGIDMLKQVCGAVAIEIILGLPGDNPESFKRTLQRSLELNAGNVHVFHTLVLPDGLMTRAPAGSNVQFDPYTLKMTSCSTWSERELGETIEWLSRTTEDAGGIAEASFWRVPLAAARTDESRLLSIPEVFLHKREQPPEPTQAPAAAPANQPAKAAPTSAAASARVTIDGALLHSFAESVLESTASRWRVADVTHRGPGIEVRFIVPGGELQVDVAPHDAGRRSFSVANGWAVAYQTPRHAMPREDLDRLQTLVPLLTSLAPAARSGDLASAAVGAAAVAQP